MLRRRLFMSLLPFVVILVGLGVYAIVLFTQLADSVNVEVGGHYQNILAGQAMSQALAGMDREMQFAAATHSTDTRLFSEYQKKFEQILAQQRKAPPSQNIRELNEQLSASYNAFVRMFGGPGDLHPPKDPQQEEAFTVSMAAMDTLVKRMRDQNYRAMLATSDRIQQTTLDVTRVMITGMAVVLLISIYTCYQLSLSILRPIQALTRATRQLGEGHPPKPVPSPGRDELGELAVSFNKMAEQLEEYRRCASEEIVRLHLTMETMLASFPDPIFVLNRDGHFDLRNPAANALVTALRLNGELPDRLQSIARKALDTGQDFLPHSFDEAVSYRINGSEKSFLPRVLVMRDKANTMFGVAVVLYDVTRFRLLDSAKTNLVATVCHELNTPLTSVRMALHLLLEKSVGNLTRKQDELLQAARSDTERLLRILNDLLDLARLEEGNDGLRRENVPPGELARAVLDQAADKVSSLGLKIRCNVDPDLPMVSVDRQRISHVFGNLVANAVKYSPPGGEILVLAVKGEDDNVEFSISDQGSGIPEEYHNRIFERFFRAPGQTKTGAGLGLSIAREITVAHGGRIGVRSSPGHGTTFFVVLKAVD